MEGKLNKEKNRKKPINHDLFCRLLIRHSFALVIESIFDVPVARNRKDIEGW